MGLIDPRDTLAIADRIGKRYYFTLVAAVSGSPDSASLRGENFFAMCHICPDGDPDVEIATLNAANTSDEAWNETSNAWTIATGMMNSISSSYSIISALTSHFSTASSGGQTLITGGWNQYLEESDTTGTDYVNIPTIVSNNTGVRVSEYFRRVANISNLRARNVFYDSPNAFEFGLVTGTGGATVVYTEIGDFGNGTTNDIADGTNFAATRMKLVVPTGSKWDSSTTLELTLVTEPDGATTTESVSITGPLVAGDSVLIGLDETARYTKVNSVTVTGGTTTSGDTLTIENVFERVIEL
jgi:hypothetical protein